MQKLLAEILRSHHPNAPATADQIAAFEVSMGWRLDGDLRAFYLHCDGAALFTPRLDSRYYIQSLAEITRARTAIRGRDDDSRGSESWYTLVDCQDSDYVILDVTQKSNGRYPLFDAWHETFPLRVRQIARSFGEFLGQALASNDRLFWLQP